MALATDDLTDPEAALRKRIAAQLQADPTVAAPTTTTPATLPSANFTTQGAGGGVQVPDVPDEVPNPTPEYVPVPTPAPTPAPPAPDYTWSLPDEHNPDKVKVDAPTVTTAGAGSGPGAAIDELYKKYGVTDKGEGSGFFDRAYWLRRINETGDPDYFLKRLDANLNGTGTDEGTDAHGVYHPAQAGAGAGTPANVIQPPTPTPTGGGRNEAPTVDPAKDDFNAQIRALLLARLKAAGEPVNEDDAGITQAMTAARDEGNRASATERSALAERLYAQGGLNTQALTQQIQQSGERNAGALGSLRSNLILKEIQGKRAELTNMMQLAVQTGDAESARAIQMQIAALDAQVRREGLGLDAAKYAAYLNALASQNVTG